MAGAKTAIEDGKNADWLKKELALCVEISCRNIFYSKAVYFVECKTLLFYSDGSLGNEYPFTLIMTKRCGSICAKCPYYK